MTTRARLDEDLKEAMRKGDVLRRSVIRYLRSAIHNEEIANRAELDEDGTLGVLSRQAQQRRESIEAYTRGGRPDLVEKEKAELAMILEYLPEQLSGEEVARLVQQAIEEVGATGVQDMGRVMGKVMPQVRGIAGGREVSAIVSELLTGLSRT